MFSFLGDGKSEGFANENSRRLPAIALIRALSAVIEYRAIWEVLLRVRSGLTNEELNRALARIGTLDDAPGAADAILKAREANDVTQIGPRLYEPDRYDDPTTRSDQRKAMNPLFLLAGGGRLFLAMEPDEEFRRLEDWARDPIEEWLRDRSTLVHASTETRFVRLMEQRSCVPLNVWEDQ